MGNWILFSSSFLFIFIYYFIIIVRDPNTRRVRVWGNKSDGLLTILFTMTHMCSHFKQLSSLTHFCHQKMLLCILLVKTSPVVKSYEKPVSYLHDFRVPTLTRVSCGHLRNSKLVSSNLYQIPCLRPQGVRIRIGELVLTPCTSRQPFQNVSLRNSLGART